MHRAKTQTIRKPLNIKFGIAEASVDNLNGIVYIVLLRGINIGIRLRSNNSRKP